jgi:hypothetical protein
MSIVKIIIDTIYFLILVLSCLAQTNKQTHTAGLGSRPTFRRSQHKIYVVPCRCSTIEQHRHGHVHHPGLFGCPSTIQRLFVASRKTANGTIRSHSPTAPRKTAGGTVQPEICRNPSSRPGTLLATSCRAPRTPGLRLVGRLSSGGRRDVPGCQKQQECQWHGHATVGNDGHGQQHDDATATTIVADQKRWL